MDDAVAYVSAWLEHTAGLSGVTQGSLLAFGPAVDVAGQAGACFTPVRQRIDARNVMCWRPAPPGEVSSFDDLLGTQLLAAWWGAVVQQDGPDRLAADGDVPSERADRRAALRGGRLTLDEVVTSTYKPEDVNTAYADVREGQKGPRRAVVLSAARGPPVPPAGWGRALDGDTDAMQYRSNHSIRPAGPAGARWCPTMTKVNAPTRTEVALRRPDRFYIGGEWMAPSTGSAIEVVDSATEEVYLRVAEAQPVDIDRAVTAAREAFDEGPWPTLSHAERARYLRAIADGVRARGEDVGQIWPRESGILHSVAKPLADGVANTYDSYAGLAGTFPFEERAQPTGGGVFGLLVREPVGVVAAIIPWNGPMPLAAHKIGPALLAGCTVVLKASPEAPGSAYLMAEVAESVGLPPGVLNVLTADREVSELLVRDPRIDKISFTGSTAAGRRIASLCGERIARYTLELGGKSAAVVLDDVDLEQTAATLSTAECILAGQVCASLTRIVVSRHRHDALVEALASRFSQVRVGDPFDPDIQMGPLAARRQRERVLGLIEQGKAEGATLATGGGRPVHLDRGWFVEPTVFGNVDNSSTIAREEIFGPVLSVIPAADEADAVRIANDTIYGLNASVFTDDVDRALAVARRLRSGTVGHNNFRDDFGIAFGGFKQSGIGREGGKEGLAHYLETKTVILEDLPAGYDA